MALSSALKKSVDSYYAALEAYKGKQVTHETALCSAFQSLLAAFAQTVGRTLVPEQKLTVGKRIIRPDGTLRDTINLRYGYWEAKDADDDLDVEIRKKITSGYPTTNSIFEDTRRAVPGWQERVRGRPDTATPAYRPARTLHPLQRPRCRGL